jgi:hypothetical protein
MAANITYSCDRCGRTANARAMEGWGKMWLADIGAERDDTDSLMQAGDLCWGCVADLATFTSNITVEPADPERERPPRQTHPNPLSARGEYQTRRRGKGRPT